LAKKSWQQKFESAEPPAISVIEKPMFGMAAGSRVLISSPDEIATLLRSIPAGQTREVEWIRVELANRHGADATCPLTTGIFLRIIGEYEIERHAAGVGVEKLIPFWRVVKPKSPLAKKLSCGPDWIAERRQAEVAG